MKLSLEHASGTIAELIRQHAAQAPRRPALVQGGRSLDYGGLDERMDRIVSALQKERLGPGDAIAICAGMSIDYAAVFLGALRAGVAVAPLAPGSGADSLRRMVQDAQARLVFVDRAGADALGPEPDGGPARVALDQDDGGSLLDDWLAGADQPPRTVEIEPDWPFNIIYSSGTTGEPKGIVQSHGMRWTHVQRGAAYGYGPDTVTLLSTPLYSNTTLVVFCPTLPAVAASC